MMTQRARAAIGVLALMAVDRYPEMTLVQKSQLADEIARAVSSSLQVSDPANGVTGKCSEIRIAEVVLAALQRAMAR